MKEDYDLSTKEIIEGFLKDIEKLTPTLTELGYKIKKINHIEAKEVSLIMSIDVNGKNFEENYKYISYGFICSHWASTFNYLANRLIIDMINSITRQIFKNL